MAENLEIYNDVDKHKTFSQIVTSIKLFYEILNIDHGGSTILAPYA